MIDYHSRRNTSNSGMLPSISLQQRHRIQQQIQEQYAVPKKIPGITSEIVRAQIKKYSLLETIFLKNDKTKQTRILQNFMNRPSKADRPGYIYGFMSFEQNQPYQKKYWIKMGKTIKNPFVRLDQWKKDDDRPYNSIFTIWTQYNSKLQALVHLFFDYARQHRTINGHSRKQWFYFEQRQMNAGAVNMINQLMHRIHHLSVETGQEVQASIGSSFLIKSINTIAQNILTVPNQKKNCFVLLGLNKRILLALQNLLEGKCVQFMRKRLLQQGEYIVKNTKQTYKADFNIEILPDDLIKGNLEDKFIDIYRKFHRIFKNQKIRICLALKQADLESSELIGLMKTLQLFRKFINYDHFIGQKQPFIITIFDCERQLKQQTILNYVSQIQLEIGKQNHYILSNAKYVLLPELKPNQQAQLSKSQIQQFQQLFISEKEPQFSSLAFNYESINSTSLKYTNKFTLSISLLLSNAFENLKLFSKTNQLTNIQRAQKIYQIFSCIEILKNKNNHQELFKAQQRLLNLLLIKSLQGSSRTDIKSSLQLIITFEAFLLAEISNQGNMVLSTVFNNIENDLNQRKTELRQKHNERIDFVCKRLKDGLDFAYSNLKAQSEQRSEVIKFAQELKNQVNYEACKAYLKNHKTMKEIEEVENILIVFQQTENYQKYGIKCYDTFGRVKQFAYEFLLGWNKNTKKLAISEKKIQESLQRFQVGQSSNRSHRKRQEVPHENGKFGDTGIVVNKSGVQRMSTKFNSNISNIKQLLESTFEKSAKFYLTNLSKTTFSFNISDVGINKKYIILAKNVNVKNQCTLYEIQEIKPTEKTKFKKCLIVLAESYQNFNNLLIKQSKNCKIIFLRVMGEGQKFNCVALNDPYISQAKLLQEFKIEQYLRIYVHEFY